MNAAQPFRAARRQPGALGGVRLSVLESPEIVNIRAHLSRSAARQEDRCSVSAWSITFV
jgi:hypothetical protein